MWRGECGGMSHHFLVEARVKLVGGWRSPGRMKSVRSVLKVSELNNSVKERAHQESLRGKYEVWRRCEEVESVEKEWEKFRDTVKECTNDVFGMKRVADREDRGVNGGMKKLAVKRRAFEEWLQIRDRVTYDRCREQRVFVKLVVKVSKRMADWRWGDRLFQGYGKDVLERGNASEER